MFAFSFYLTAVCFRKLRDCIGKENFAEVYHEMGKLSFLKFELKV